MRNQLRYQRELQKSFFVIALYLFSVCACANEVSLYNANGDAVAYIDFSDEKTIFLWTGKPVAYLDDENVYGFNGKHLGWFTEGALVDHSGTSPCVTVDRHPSPNYEGYKGYKGYKPYKGYQEYAPYKPYTSNQFSSVECRVHLSAGNP